jgi:hypothetical protein
MRIPRGVRSALQTNGCRFRRLPLWGKSSACHLPYRWTCQFRARIGFAGFLGTAPQETLSGSMRDRKSREHADYELFSKMS